MVSGRSHLQGQRGLLAQEAGPVPGWHRPGVRGLQGDPPPPPHGPADLPV